MLVGSNAAWCHPVLFQRMVRNRRERGAQDRGDRSAPHRDRRRGRPVPADRAGHGHGAVLRPAGASRRHAARSITPISTRTRPALTEALARAREIAPDVAATAAAHRPCRSRRRALLRAVSRDRARRHLLFAGREPVGAGHRQGQRHHQLPSRHRPHRPARHGAVLADRPAERDGRARGRRARQPACRAHGLFARRDRPRAAVLECAAHGRRARA